MRDGTAEMAQGTSTETATGRGSRMQTTATVTAADRAAGTTAAGAAMVHLAMTIVTRNPHTETNRATETGAVVAIEAETGVTAALTAGTRTATTGGAATARPVKTAGNQSRSDRRRHTVSDLLERGCVCVLHI